MKIMHGVDTFKVTDAQQARIINNSKNVKAKLLESNAAIWFNTTCKIYHITHKYIQINIKGDNQQGRNTKLVATDEIKKLNFCTKRNKYSMNGCIRLA
jgi:hypothetical protein